MTSKFNSGRRSAYFGIALSALVTLGTIVSTGSVMAVPNRGIQRNLIAQGSNETDGSSTASDTANAGAGNEERRAKRLNKIKEYMQSNGAPAGTDGDNDMPSHRMRRLGGGGGGPTADPDSAMPGRRWRGPGANGPDGDNQSGPGVRGKFAGPGGFGGEGGPGGFHGGNGEQFRRRMRERAGGGFPPLDLTPLGLSEDQKEKIKAMREQTRLKVKDLKKNLSDKQTEMRKLMFDPDASEAQIKAACSQVRKLQVQMDDANMGDLLAIRGMLTPEQKKKLPDCAPGRNATANGGGPGGPPPGGPGGPPPGGPGGPPPGGFGGPGGPPAFPPPNAANLDNGPDTTANFKSARRAARAGRRSLKAESEGSESK